VTVEVDKSAALVLGVPAGNQKLSGEQLVKFLAPSVSGAVDAQRRQAAVLKSMFRNLQGKGIVLTAVLADQIIAGIETNLTSTDLMNNYSRFMARSDWAFKERPLPVNETKTATGMMVDPDLELIRKMFTEGQQ
jgi:anionic cell wall polymer biosynthesis LytR-Cps2A-Psr (LCP) family protein